MIESISKIESKINKALNLDAKLSAIVSNSALAYSATIHELVLNSLTQSSNDELDQPLTNLDKLYLS
ncbi:12716_t:CDS:2 [Cetraspora pellucida]|uniref:12716_t:CDS:1 n=1 Tax=Cetraspora pellucida TaxID=1433469 RepID=A0A9N8WCY9_9GLOM|nr:12716_t:CDS:2 [Cetraspora pellucida]